MVTYGIDANALTRHARTGTERYVSSLLSAMRQMPLKEDERVVLYVSRSVEELSNLPKGWEQRVLHWPWKGWTHARLSLELRLRKPDVFFTPAHEIPLFVPKTKVVYTQHDIAFRFFPELYSPRLLRRQQFSLGHALRKADRILTVSETTLNDLVDQYSVIPRRLAATPLAVRPEDFQGDAETQKQVLATYALTEGDYFLSVGRLEKKKNIELLVEAFGIWKASSSPENKTALVLGGSFGHGGEEIRQAIEASPAREAILTPGYIPEKDLPALLRGACAYVFPTRYEGFGIPALEAMAAEVPLLSSSIPALREVAGDAALFLSPADSRAWSDAMERIKTDQVLRDRLVQAGKERLPLFSWKETARRTWEVLRELA